MQSKNKKISISKTHIALAVLAVMIIGISVFGFILPNYVAAAQFNEDAAKIEEQISEMQEENEDISKSLKNKDELYEKIAREEYGYCKPGEKVYYNSSFGE